jgi:eukaryotic-like serine/threonine-protein kinase
MHLGAGTRLGPYAIEALVGAGGMGEVYRARDTRLDRLVALKVLSPVLAAHPDLRERFEREARAISTVAHPNICTLFDLGRENGTDFLVMEFLAGETLAARIERGGLPFDHALSIAIDVVSALETAHRRGIVHRDLKPGNVMLVRRPGLSGVPAAKLLDFGLAKLAAEAPVVGASVVTAPQPLTQQGMILGTFQYMAPEQLEGRDADERSDIFAFGSVFYEMLTGRRAFEGKSQASLIGAILKDQPPPVSTVHPITPPAVDRVVARCLAKDPDERWQSASDLGAELRWLQQGGAATVAHERRSRLTRRELAAWIAAAVMAVAGAIGWTFAAHRDKIDLPLVQFTLEETPDAPYPGAAIAPFPVIAPDGQRIAFVTLRAGVTQIAVRSLDNPAIHVLAGTDGASLPFWSADSRFVGFFRDGKLQRYDFTSGNVSTIAAASGFEGGTWNRDGTILFGSAAGPIFRVAADGGTPVKVTTIDAARGETSHRWPAFMPDGRHFVYVAAPKNHAWFGSLDGTGPRDLFATDAKAVFAAPGYLIYGLQGQIHARRFDPARGESSDDVTIADNVRMSAQNLRGTYSVSDNGILVYRSGSIGARTHLQWYDRGGRPQAEALSYGDYRSVTLSPDGGRVAFHKHEPLGGGGVWVKDLTRGTISRVTLNNAMHNFDEEWHPDGRHIVFAEAPASSAPSGTSGGGGPNQLFMTSVSGTGTDEPLVVSNQSKGAPAWSPDGRLLIYQQFDADTQLDVFVMAMDTRKSVPYLHGSANEILPMFSPDGKWVAYSSDESGRYEVYVQPYPATGDKWPISTAGGVQPRWRGDGKELFYLSLTLQMTAVDIAASGPQLNAGLPHVLFTTRASTFSGLSSSFRQFAAAPDGQSFLINEAAPAAESEHDPMRVIINWTSLRR